MSESKDVEMKDANASIEETRSIIEEIESSFNLLEKASNTFDNRYVSKVIRDFGPLRKKILNYESVLPTIINDVFPNNYKSKQDLLNLFTAQPLDYKSNKSFNFIPEIELYIYLLIQVYLLDTNQIQQLNELSPHLIKIMNSYNRRSLDFIQAKIWFYISRGKELSNDLISIRNELIYNLRTSSLRHDTETTASIITLLLRNYLLYHDIQQASNLVEKIQFPENSANSLIARYYYYLARINAVQLDYSSAHEYVIAAIRKAPQTKFTNGFIQSATKLNIVIELLMGEIPELKTFKSGKGNFEPYFNVTKAVKLGDLKLFKEVLNKYESIFKKDDNYTLILRLRQNVIKTGIRIISLSYSKISLKDICIKLHLDSEESTEYIVSKAIRDGVIEATINHEKGYMKSKEILNIYSTNLPQQEFNQRIKFCLSLHNDSVKSMRFPNDNEQQKITNKEIENDEVELLKAIEEGDLDDFI
ncbi:RPN3 [Candida pseudojiufengensis]|uniref:RPN3 n=1 Tax=Candida pseudojiufengensis TaxID=497109 RepID=UPI002224577C|nr:RPN3 [Candida pseudojiufengensis]KAI5966273.1 RPN3 [Candida pseudojiufengensis]